MKKAETLLVSLIAAMALVFGAFWFAFYRSAPAAITPPIGSLSARPAIRSPLQDDSGTPTPPTGLNGDETPPAALVNAAASIDTLPTPVPGNTQLYFVPTDNDATATVLYLYNTEPLTQTVPVRGFSYNGVLVYSLNITIAPTSFLRLASDSIAAAPPPSWATPAPVITNFTDFTYYAMLSLPKGVKAEGYALFNPGTGVVDPRKDQGAIPLRFSTDPASLFLPEVKTNP